MGDREGRKAVTINISLDLETWGTTPGSDIRSIGACIFAPDGRHGALVHDGSLGTIRPFYIATDNPNISEYAPKYPLTRDQRTVQLWSEQSDEAEAPFKQPTDLREALRIFSNWLCDLIPAPYVPSHGLVGINLWSHGAAFDPPILAAAYAAVGLPVPWHYRAPRDTRTLFDVAGITDHSAWLAARPGPLGIPHHALDDAICQARAICDAFAEMTRGRN